MWHQMSELRTVSWISTWTTWFCFHKPGASFGVSHLTTGRAGNTVVLAQIATGWWVAVDRLAPDFLRETWRAVLPQSHGKFSSNRKVAKGIQFFGSCHFYGPIADWFDLGNVAFGTVCFFLKFGRFRGRHLGFELVKDPSRWLEFWAIWSPRWRRSKSVPWVLPRRTIDWPLIWACWFRQAWMGRCVERWDRVDHSMTRSFLANFVKGESRPSLSILTPFLGTALTHSRHRSYIYIAIYG